VRDLNEDSYFAQLLPLGLNNPWDLQALLVVADGMGGHNAGEVASRLAVKTAREIFASEKAAEIRRRQLRGRTISAYLEKAVQYINDVVHRASTGEGMARPGTTLTLVLVHDNNFYIGHVGDSRAYLIRDGHIDQITADDSWVAEQVRAGRMTEQEARASPFRNQLTQSIGSQAEVQPSVYPGAFRDGDLLVLCSDGLSEYVTAEEIADIALSNPTAQAACDQLVNLANTRGGEDNITVVIACVGQPQAAARAVTPPLARGLSVQAARAVTQPFTPVRPPEPTSREPALSYPRSHHPTRLEQYMPLILLVLVGLLAAGIGMLAGQIVGMRMKRPPPEAVPVKTQPAIGDQTSAPAERSPSVSGSTNTPDLTPLITSVNIHADQDRQGLVLDSPNHRVSIARPGKNDASSNGNGIFVKIKNWTKTIAPIQAGESFLVVQQSDDETAIRLSGQSMEFTVPGLKVGIEYDLYFENGPGRKSYKRLLVTFRVE